jgi:hypothetical protein
MRELSAVLAAAGLAAATALAGLTRVPGCN